MSQYVHDLIAKLTMREKGYFKLMATMKGDSHKNYLKLYDFIERKPQYDQERVRAAFDHLPMGKYLSSEYNYLATQIMKSLVNFHFDKASGNKIQKKIFFINILIGKGLKTKALKILKHTKKIAYKNELFAQAISLIALEEELLFKEGNLGDLEKFKSLELERQSLVDQINNFNETRILRVKIRELWFQEGFFNETPIDHPILNHPIVNHGEYILSIRAKEHWHYIVAMKAFILQNFEIAIQQFQIAIEFVKSSHFLRNQNSLFTLISNYLYCCAFARDSAAFERGLKELNGLNDDKYITFVRYSRSLELYYHMQDTEKGKSLEEKIHSYMAKNKHQLEITHSNYMYFLLVRNNIVSRTFEDALDCINLWRQLTIAKYLYAYLKLFTLIVYLELEYYSLLKSEIETSSKVLRKHKQYGILAKKMISFFKKTLRTPQKEMSYLIQLKNYLSEDRTELKTSRSYNYFNYLTWVEKRIHSLQLKE